MSRILLLLACFAVTFAMPALSLGNSMDTKQLEVADTGPYIELNARTNPDNLVLVYIPSLGSLLERASTLKGSALSEQEIAAISNNASVIALPESVASSVLEGRDGVR